MSTNTEEIRAQRYAALDAETAIREAALLEKISKQRRLARPEDYVYDKAQEAFWDLQDGTLHSEKAVDASIPQELWRVVVEEAPEPEAGATPRRGRPARRRERLVPPSRDIQRVENDQFVEGSTRMPNAERIVRDKFQDGRGIVAAAGRRLFNTYTPHPPIPPEGNPAKAGPWSDLVEKLFPDRRETEYFYDWLAFLKQHPEIKCNVGVVLSGQQGIGKDTILTPVKRALGVTNVTGITPDMLFSDYKTFLETDLLVVDEARPSKDDYHATSLYGILKPLIAAPPDTLPVNEKFKSLRHVPNLLRVLITTNDWTSLHVPEDDRRLFILHSVLRRQWHIAEGKPDMFVDFAQWLEDEHGYAHVAAFLAARDVTRFRPKDEAIKTVGWHAVAAGWAEPEDDVRRAIDLLGNPDVILSDELTKPLFDGAEEVKNLLKSPHKISRRMLKAGYLAVPPPEDDRHWRFLIPGTKNYIKARTAFVRQELMGSGADGRAAILRHGRERAEQAPKVKEVSQ